MNGLKEPLDDMATADKNITRDRYRHCLIPPMGRKSEDGPQREHIVDAALVGIVSFGAVILVDVLPTLLTGDPNYLAINEIMARVPTAAVASLLAFAAMWARARGINALEVLRQMGKG